jgi:hypothetical protein
LSEDLKGSSFWSVSIFKVDLSQESSSASVFTEGVKALNGEGKITKTSIHASWKRLSSIVLEFNNAEFSRGTLGANKIKEEKDIFVVKWVGSCTSVSSDDVEELGEARRANRFEILLCESGSFLWKILECGIAESVTNLSAKN